MELSTFFDFCSGIGGGRLGLEQIGLKSVGYSDTSRLSVTTYKQLFNTENEKNFGNLKKSKLPPAEPVALIRHKWPATSCGKPLRNASHRVF